MKPFTVIIPARYASSRFPGKPLIDIAGKSMIQRVYEQASKSAAREVCVATDDDRIASAVTAFGGKVVMTAAAHATGTDRIHEAAELLQLDKDDVIVNVQGDEPLIPPEVINDVAAAISPAAEMATLCEPIKTIDDILDPNIVKVVMSKAGLALYFSRAPVPYDRDGFPQQRFSTEPALAYRHLGIYAYTKHMLDQFVRWPEGALEAVEKLEQLRVMENGGSIAIAISRVTMPPGIDVPADLERTLALIGSEELN